MDYPARRLEFQLNCDPALARQARIDELMDQMHFGINKASAEKPLRVQ